MSLAVQLSPRIEPIPRSRSQRARQLQELGCDDFTVHGGMPHEQITLSLQLFRRYAIPAFQ
jgi:hypothetical protein